MKKLFTLLLLASAVLYQGCSPSSFAHFATVGNSGWKVTLYHYSSSVKIQEDGKDCYIVGNAHAAHRKPGYIAAQNGSNGTELVTNGIQLDKTSETHVITVSRGEKSVNITFTTKSPPFIDVTGVLGETKTMSIADLQEEFLKNHKKA
jgi:hypothetical protein